MQYTFHECEQWGEEYLETVWNDFAGDEDGIIFTIWDPSRLLWFIYPEQMPAQLQKFLRSGRFKRWGYFPIDAVGPRDELIAVGKDVISCYDRPLTYGAWGSEVASRTLNKPVDWIPHGFNGKKFKLRDKKAARIAFGFEKEDLIIGCNMTNQARKDWGTAFMVAKLLQEQDRRFKFWFHTDRLINSWNILALQADLKVEARVTTVLTDEQLSYGYNCCDATMLPSLGEGFGFPIVESLACGTPVIHTQYGGGVELVPFNEWLIPPLALRLEGIHNCIRPVLDPLGFSEAIVKSLGMQVTREEVARSVEHLDYKNLWPVWERWFREGLSGTEVADVQGA